MCFALLGCSVSKNHFYSLLWLMSQSNSSYYISPVFCNARSNPEKLGLRIFLLLPFGDMGFLEERRISKELLASMNGEFCAGLLNANI